MKVGSNMTLDMGSTPDIAATRKAECQTSSSFENLILAEKKGNTPIETGEG